MPECLTAWHPVSLVPEWTKIPMPEPVRYWNKGAQSGTGMLWYRTEIQDAGPRCRPRCRCPAMHVGMAAEGEDKKKEQQHILNNSSSSYDSFCFRRKRGYNRSIKRYRWKSSSSTVVAAAPCNSNRTGKGDWKHKEQPLHPQQQLYNSTPDCSLQKNQRLSLEGRRDPQRISDSERWSFQIWTWGAAT